MFGSANRGASSPPASPSRFSSYNSEIKGGGHPPAMSSPDVLYSPISDHQHQHRRSGSDPLTSPITAGSADPFLINSPHQQHQHHRSSSSGGMSPQTTHSDESKDANAPAYYSSPHSDNAVKEKPLDRRSSFPPDSPWANLHRASLYASRPPTGNRMAFAPVFWPDVIILLVVVAVSWCLGQFAPTPWVDGMSLTAARIVVAVIGVIIGVACGYALVLRIGRRIYAATMYATLVHSEMPLREIDKCAEPGPVAALHLLRWRLLNPSVKRHNRPYDTRPWAIWVIYFLGLSLLANIGNFLYGRTVIIYTQTMQQTTSWNSIPVLGELDQADLSYALLIAPTFQSPQEAWSYAAPASFYSVPSPASLNWTDSTGQNRTAFFTDATPALFSPSSVGPAASLWRQFLKQNKGTQADRTTPGDDATQNIVAQGADALRTRSPVPVAVDYPAWGTEVRCASFLESQAIVNVATDGGVNFGFPLDPVKSLMTDLGLDTALLSSPTGNVNMTQTTVFAPAARGDGVALTFNASVLDSGASGNGFVTLEFVLARVNLNQAPTGHFFITANVSQPEAVGPAATAGIGIDGAVCVTHVSPFIVRAVDTAGVSSLTQIVFQGAQLPPIPGGSQGDSLFDAPTQTLSSMNKSVAFLNGYGSARNNLMKDNGPSTAYDAAIAGLYPPNPSLVQMTNVSTTVDTMPISYGVLDSGSVALVLAGAQARYLLPYMVGGGRVAGRAYPYASVAYAYVKTGYLALLMGIILMLGLLGSFFVPRPPFNLPLRDLNVSSWLTFADQVPERMLRDEDAMRELESQVKLRYGK